MSVSREDMLSEVAQRRRERLLVEGNDPARTAILIELGKERDRQDVLFGGADHDARHSPSDWIAILCRHLGLAVSDGAPNSAASDLDVLGTSRYRRQLVRLASVAVAAIEADDRKRIAWKADPLNEYRLFAQRCANDQGEAVLLVCEPQPSPISGTVSQCPYVVPVSAVEVWETRGKVERFEPATKS